MKKIMAELRTSLAAVVFLAVILCGLYPLTVWVLAQGLFPAQANGSLIVREGQVVGSSLIGRNFAGARYFHPRPSAAGQGYDALGSGGSNLGPLSQRLSDSVRGRIDAYRTENGLATGAVVPPDAVTASASGLDPHISLANALLQIPRVARARGIGESAVKRHIEKFTAGRDLGILGEPRVNVLLLNISLDDVQKSDLAGVTASGNK